MSAIKNASQTCRPSYAIGTWKNPGAVGAYRDAPRRGAPVQTGERKKG